MAKIEDGELNKTQGKIMDYLRPILADGEKYVSFDVIAKKVHVARNTVRYNVGRLIQMGMLYAKDRKLGLP